MRTELHFSDGTSADGFGSRRPSAHAETARARSTRSMAPETSAADRASALSQVRG